MINPKRNDCPFCHANLNNHDLPYQDCRDVKSHPEIFYSQCEEWAAITIHGYRFSYEFDKHGNPTNMDINFKENDNWVDVTLDYHIEVTLDNYMELIERVKKLQAFQ